MYKSLSCSDEEINPRRYHFPLYLMTKPPPESPDNFEKKIVFFAQQFNNELTIARTSVTAQRKFICRNEKHIFIHDNCSTYLPSLLPTQNVLLDTIFLKSLLDLKQVPSSTTGRAAQYGLSLGLSTRLVFP